MTNFVLNMLSTENAEIGVGASLSEGVSFGGLRLFGIVMPAAWTAAAITFQVSHDNGVTWHDLYDADGAEVTVQAAASRTIALDPVLYSAVSMIKVRSGTTSAPVNQVAACDVGLVLRSV